VGALSVADRATIANMAPEYGATIGVFPIDDASLSYLRMSNRPAELIALVEAYAKEQGLFRVDGAPDPVFSDTLSLDLSTVVPSLAGPKRPQDRINLPDVKQNFLAGLTGEIKSAELGTNGARTTIHDGSVVVAAITSCTNTSNPSVMVAAGLLAKKAVERGLQVKPWVKTSLAPGSKVVMDYLNDAGLVPFLEKLRFNLVGYGCTTCIGNSGPLPDDVSAAVQKAQLTVASVLSGNRNFEGRIQSQVRANYLASPPLVVAYALAGRVDIDLTKEPLGQDSTGHDVFLNEIWPAPEEIRNVVEKSVQREMFQKQYSEVFAGDAQWNSIKVPAGASYAWSDRSTYIKRAPYFDELVDAAKQLADMKNMRALAVLGDSVTTDHISPAGNIAVDSPAGKYLISLGVKPVDFNSYGSRRGNHEVMVRGTLANVRLRNMMAPGTEGCWTTHLPSNERMFIYDAAVRYREEGVPLIIVAGKEYGAGSSRDWAAKGVLLLGVRAVIAESFERIHRSNLVGMGVLPLEFVNGQNRESLGLTGLETFAIEGIQAAVESNGRKHARVTATQDGKSKSFEAAARIDTPVEIEYYRSGGILPYVLRQLAASH
jgi:aconitate hydratase